MIAIMGTPPKEMLQNSEYATKFFDRDGTIIYIPFLPYVGATDQSNQATG
jgi:hypothetical protein